MSQRLTVLSRGRGGMFRVGTGDTANDYGVNNKMPKTISGGRFEDTVSTMVP
jgi:hypothetical protein